MRVEDNVVEAIVLRDLGVDCNGALVAKAAAELDVVEGNGVVRGLDPGAWSEGAFFFCH
jgi:hypothetical protein